MSKGVIVGGRLRLIVSAALAALSVVLCLLYGQGVRAEAERERAETLERYGGEVVRLVVATEQLEIGDVVSRQNVAERDWLADLAPQGALVSADELMGSEVTVPAAAGAPLSQLNFRETGGQVEVPDGKVALSLAVSEKLGLPAGLRAGSELAAYEVTDAGVRLVAGSLQVLSAPAEQQALGTRGAVVVAVQPGDVASVLAASAEGSLRMALPADDVEELETGAVAAPSRVEAEKDGGLARDDEPGRDDEPEAAGSSDRDGDPGVLDGGGEPR